MNYLVSKFACVVFNDKEKLIQPNVKYEIESETNFPLYIVGFNGEVPFYFDIFKSSSNVCKVKHKQDTYFFLDTFRCTKNYFVNISCNNHNISISLSSNLAITVDGKIMFDEAVENLEYSSYEIEGKLCVIYFKGERNFVVVIEDDNLIVATYYDECNIEAEEKYFMCRLNDSLNHGRVVHIKDKNVENYLVYLDNYDLNLKEKFLPFVFLDCVLARNFKYCNNLLCEDVKQEKDEDIKEFFPQFDWFYPLEDKTFALIKKNTLAGVCKFEINNCQVENVIHL